VTALRDVSLLDLLACADQLPETTLRRCRFSVEEEARVLALADALEHHDRACIADLMAASYRGARDLFEIGTGHMEAMMTAMRGGPGVIGARQAGAGFGGCMVAVVDAGQVADFISHVERAYGEATGLQPRVYPVQPSAGAGLVAGM
jgi:galactokinase